MLTYLRIRNIAVVEDLEAEFGPGLNVVTGETGSGKSILIDSVGLLAGGRASADMVRTGEQKAVVEGVFTTAQGDPVLREMDGLGLDVGDGEILVRREISASGQGRVFVNGSPSTAGALRRIGDHLVEIHGQHDTRLLLYARYHQELLDESHGDQSLADVPRIAGELAKLREEMDALDQGEHSRLQRLDLLDFQLAEIGAASPAGGEDVRLEEERRILVHAEKLKATAAEAAHALYEADGAMTVELNRTLSRLQECARLDARLEKTVETLASVAYQMEDAASFLRDYADGVESNRGRLDEIEARLALLDRLKRKYGPSLDDVARLAESVREERERLSGKDERQAWLSAELRRRGADYLEAAGRLSLARRGSAARIEESMKRHLADLAMSGTRLHVSFCPRPETPPFSPSGLEDVEFLVSPNVGESPKPMRKIASGGELSRLALALRLVLRSDPGAVLVFDEVDAGLGGGVAEMLGRKLLDVARGGQTFCITHVPQIAALADRHFLVEKEVSGDRTRARIKPLDDGGREAELARMLGGIRPSESSVRHARQLLADRSGNQRQAP